MDLVVQVSSTKMGSMVLFIGLLLVVASCQKNSNTAVLTIDHSQAEVTDQQKNRFLADESLALADLEPKRALDLFLAIDPTKLDRLGQATYRRLEKRFSLVKLSRQHLGLSHNNISAVSIDDEDLWMGDWLGSLSRYSLATEELMVVRAGKASTMVQSLNAILIEDRYLWAASSDTIIRFDKKRGETTYIDRPTVIGYPWDIVRYQGKIVLAHQNGGLWELRGERFVKSSLDHSALKTVNKMLVVDDILYAATNDGLWRYNNGWLQAPSFKGQNIFSLLFYKGMLWVGTERNLYRYRDNGRAISQNLPMGFIKSLVVVDNLLFAASSDGGLAKINLQSLLTEQSSYHNSSPSLLRIGSLAYSKPYLVIGTLGNALILMHESLF